MSLLFALPLLCRTLSGKAGRVAEQKAESPRLQPYSTTVDGNRRGRAHAKIPVRQRESPDIPVVYGKITDVMIGHPASLFVREFEQGNLDHNE